MQQSGNTILVTGGGSGIGAALARRWNDLGNTVIVAGRGREGLENTISGRENMHALEFDAASAEDLPAFRDRLLAEHPSLNVVFNGAGIMPLEQIGAKRDLKDAEQVITTNLLGPIRLIDALVDHLKTQPNAAIITVSSGLAFLPLVASATYSATKAAIHSYSISLREALKGSVEVLEMIPPAVRTGLTPGQEKNEAFMPLDEFIDETMSLLGQQPTPPELTVGRVGFQRNAEKEGRFDQALAQQNAH